MPGQRLRVLKRAISHLLNLGALMLASRAGLREGRVCCRKREKRGIAEGRGGFGQGPPRETDPFGQKVQGVRGWQR